MKRATIKQLVDEILRREAVLSQDGAGNSSKLARFYIETDRLAKILPIQQALRHQANKRLYGEGKP
jgi:hypothetical protein